MKNPLRKRWGVCVIGNYSGQRTSIPFLKFRTREQAQAWVDKPRTENPMVEEATRYQVEERP